MEELLGPNIRSLRLKATKSMAITFYLDCGLIGDVHVERPRGNNEPIVDEFSHFTNANIEVYPSGDVKIVEGEGNDEEVDAEEKTWMKRNSFFNKKKRRHQVVKNSKLIKSNAKKLKKR